MSFASFSFDYATGRGALLDPTTISGLAGWWDFSDLTTLFQNTIGTTPVTADGQGIARANDKSGNGRNVLQGGASAPVYKAEIRNGLSIARLNGTNQWLTASSFVQSASGGLTLFAVGAYSAYVSGNNTMAGFLSNATPAITTAVLRRTASGTFAFSSYDGTSAIVSDTETADDTDWHYYSGTKGPGTSLIARVDGGGVQSLVPFTPATSGQTFSVGSRASSAADLFTGDIGEVLLYNVNLSAADRVAVETYLHVKWGISSVLDGLNRNLQAFYGMDEA